MASIATISQKNVRIGYLLPASITKSIKANQDCQIIQTHQLSNHSTFKINKIRT